jgi:hypothetical protein
MAITPRSHRMLLAGAVALFALAGIALVVAVDVGGGDSATDEEGPGFEPRPGQLPTATATPPVTDPTAPPTTAPLTPEAISPVREAALRAALRYFNASDDPAICKADPPRKRACINHDTTEKDSPARGVAVFGLAFADGGGALVVFGRDEAGGWQFWFGTQQSVYHALSMPAEMRVCADGQGANVRMAPNLAAESLGTLKDGSVLTAMQFLLTEPGWSSPQPLRAGNGWYQVTGEINGFIRADLLSVTSQPGCKLRVPTATGL